MASEAPPSDWIASRLLGWALLGALALAAAEALGPAGATIWFVPAAMIILAIHAPRRTLLLGGLLLWLGAVVPFVWTSPSPAYFAWVAAGAAVDVAAMLVVARRLARRHDAPLLVMGVAAARVVVELLWRCLPVGEVCLWGVYRLDYASVAQVMHLGGAAAVSFTVAFIGAAAGVMLAEPDRRGALRTISFGLALLALLSAVGSERIGLGSSEGLRVGTVAVADGDLSRLAELTSDAAGESAVVVVWPENALDPEQDPAALQLVNATARDNHLWLVAGSWNSTTRQAEAILAGPIQAAGPQADVGEHQPPPDGWRRPWHGPRPEARTTGFGGVSIIVGHDVMFPGPALRASLDGATVAALPGRDLPGCERRLRWMARVRALENGLVVVRAARHGSSYVIDPYGRVLTHTEADGEPEHVLVGNPRLERVGTLLAGARRRFPWVCGLLLLVLWQFDSRRRQPDVREFLSEPGAPLGR